MSYAWVTVLAASSMTIKPARGNDDVFIMSNHKDSYSSLGDGDVSHSAPWDEAELFGAASAAAEAHLLAHFRGIHPSEADVDGWDDELLRLTGPDSTHRRAQSPWAVPPIGGNLSAATKNTVCHDALASNDGKFAGACTYDCATLTKHYFPQQPSQKVRCFAFDVAVKAWPAELMAMRNTSYKTIIIPNDESWILHGTVMDGLPVKLDARFASGTPLELSRANIVFRRLRFSGQDTPLDPYTNTRTYPTMKRLGGALLYDGFGATIIIDGVIFDHNGLGPGGPGVVFQSGGTVLWIDCHMDKSTNDTLTTGRDNTFTFTMINTLSYANLCFAHPAAIKNMWPHRLHIENTSFIDNIGVTSMFHSNFYPYPSGQTGFMHGNSSNVLRRVVFRENAPWPAWWPGPYRFNL